MILIFVAFLFVTALGALSSKFSSALQARFGARVHGSVHLSSKAPMQGNTLLDMEDQSISEVNN